MFNWYQNDIWLIFDWCFIVLPAAIIGAGIGGTTSAYYLRELFGDRAHIEIFEPGEVGGRLATVAIDGHEYEAGGSIIHPGNQYMVNFTRILGGWKRANTILADEPIVLHARFKYL